MRFAWRQALQSSTRLGAGFAGDGLLVRLRSTVVAMLGAVAAVGLTLVAVAAQVGWPSVLSGPLPQAPGPTFARNATLVAPGPDAGRPGAIDGAHSGSDSRSAQPVGGQAPSSALTAASPVESPAPPPPSSQQPAVPESGRNGPTSPTPAPSRDLPPAPDEPAPTAADPPAGEAPSSPVTAAPDDSPGHSGESHGHHYGGGPPPWAGSKSSDPSGGEDDSGAHGHDGGDDHGGGWGHH